MCHYLCGGLHGRQKRVKAQSESSKSVVNSVLISREMPVFPGFLEIIRVVYLNKKVEVFKIDKGDNSNSYVIQLEQGNAYYYVISDLDLDEFEQIIMGIIFESV